jgi:hypothetical protein
MSKTASQQEDDKSKDPDHDYPWKKEQEDILKKWADKAICYQVMHERAYKRFWCMNAWFNIPVIVISTITGTGNFASSTFGPNGLMYTFIIGGFNILAGVIATIGTYIGAAQKCEGHRFASIHWDKFARKVQIELTKKRLDRIKVKIFMKQVVEEFDRLIEMSPVLPNDIIRWFSDMVDDVSDEYTDCGICCFECFCFACGCNICTSCLTKCKATDICSKEKKCSSCKTQIIKHINTKSNWSEMAIPEIIGRISKTLVAEVDIVPEVVTKIVEPIEDKGSNPDEIYTIYN